MIVGASSRTSSSTSRRKPFCRPLDQARRDRHRCTGRGAPRRHRRGGDRFDRLRNRDPLRPWLVAWISPSVSFCDGRHNIRREHREAAANRDAGMRYGARLSPHHHPVMMMRSSMSARVRACRHGTLPAGTRMAGLVEAATDAAPEVLREGSKRRLSVVPITLLRLSLTFTSRTSVDGKGSAGEIACERGVRRKHRRLEQDGVGMVRVVEDRAASSLSTTLPFCMMMIRSLM